MIGQLLGINTFTFSSRLSHLRDGPFIRKKFLSHSMGALIHAVLTKTLTLSSRDLLYLGGCVYSFELVFFFSAMSGLIIYSNVALCLIGC